MSGSFKSEIPVTTYDPFGVGGSTTIGSKSVPVIVEYIPSVEGGFVYNRTPVPIRIELDITWEYLKKNGTGRPKFNMLYYDADYQRDYWRTQNNLTYYGESKGYGSRSGGVLQPGKFIQLQFQDLDFAQGETVTRWTITDDYDTVIGPVSTRTRDVPSGVTEDVVPPEENSATPFVGSVFTWYGGSINQGDVLGLKDSLDGFPYGMSYNGTTIFNTSNPDVLSVAFCFYVSNPVSWATVGQVEGGYDGSVSNRFMGIMSLAPGESAQITPDNSFANDIRGVFAFSTVPFANRYQGLVG
ncbi:hypothetical protein [Apple virus E]|nr:hypothetical protein [Apple virus E]